MRTTVLVTATEYGVSCTSGDGIEGVLLDVYKLDRSIPNFWGGMGVTVYAVKAMPFPNHDAADAYCLKHGWLKVYESRPN